MPCLHLKKEATLKAPSKGFADTVKYIAREPHGTSDASNMNYARATFYHLDQPIRKIQSRAWRNVNFK